MQYKSSESEPSAPSEISQQIFPGGKFNKCGGLCGVRGEVSPWGRFSPGEQALQQKLWTWNWNGIFCPSIMVLLLIFLSASFYLICDFDVRFQIVHTQCRSRRRVHAL